MKNLLKVALVAGCMLVVGTVAKAQTKIGYVNFNQVIDQTPEVKVLKTQIDAFSQTYSTSLQNMQAEYQQKAQIYEKDRATMTDAVRTIKEGELTDLGKRIQDFNTTAQQKVQEYSNEKSKPLIDKVKAAINQVAKEKGYAYVLDSSQVELLVSPEGDNLMDAVKAKLGLAAGAAPAKK